MGAGKESLAIRSPAVIFPEEKLTMADLKIIGSRRPAQTPGEYLRVAAALRRRFRMLTPLPRPERGILKFPDWESLVKWEAGDPNSRGR
jgi:hypothetical protein